ncbi:MAG: hypothetical protein EOO07_26710 [Chitinophagaceae bacterium]|nr:MAG: hypothetical protein EOO07_26710 [Chitinophagaceae bacterium]
MDNLIRINLKKLKFTFLFSALVCGTVTAVLLLIAESSGQFPDRELLFVIVPAALIGLPVLICAIAFTTWFFRHKQQRRFFNRVMKSHLVPMGFDNGISNLETKWKFATECYELESNGLKISMCQNEHTSSEMEFTFAQSTKNQASEVQKILRITKHEIDNMSPIELQALLMRDNQ